MSYGFAVQRMVQNGLNINNGNALLAELKQVDIIGGTGRVRYTATGDRIGIKNLVGTVQLRDGNVRADSVGSLTIFVSQFI